MKDKFAVSMFGQKRLSREGGIEIVVKRTVHQNGTRWMSGYLLQQIWSSREWCRV